MCESPAHAIRTKKRSSIVLANKLCKTGDSDAVISAGNTGAAMASSLLYMGRLSGVIRPAILGILPSKKNMFAMLDLGANTDCKPEHLYQFAVMASFYTAHVLGYANPRVGLLSIGEERSKGNDLTITTFNLLEKSNLNFIGNIEGRDIFEGIADVVVCDGFVGNVLLKFAESVFGFFTHRFREKVSKGIVRSMSALYLKPVFKEIKHEMTPDEYGGAQLLGVDGVSIICHGNSPPLAIMNAIRVARQLVLKEVNELIKAEFERKSSIPDE
jgi:glycerol-3-phosphate acyltransferase PlsX